VPGAWVPRARVAPYGRGYDKHNRTTNTTGAAGSTLLPVEKPLQVAGASQPPASLAEISLTSVLRMVARAQLRELRQTRPCVRGFPSVACVAPLPRVGRQQGFSRIAPLDLTKQNRGEARKMALPKRLAA
jgi:hypothetical protein